MKLLSTLFFILLATFAWSQDPDLVINVNVADTSGAPVENVDVFVVDSFGLHFFTGFTNADGHISFEIDSVDSGNLFLIGVLDCDGNILSEIYEFQTGPEIITIDFIYCADPINNMCNVWIGEEYTGANLPQLVANASGVEPITYEWSTGELTQAITPQMAGVYCVTITDATGCVASSCYDYIGIWIDTFCYADIFLSADTSGGLVAVATGWGVPPYSYDWSTGDTTMVIQVDPNDSILCVTVTDATDCESTMCLDIGSSCDVWIACDPVGTLTAFGYGIEPLEYLWSTGETSPSIFTQPGDTYCVTVTDATGCEATACQTIDTFNIDTFCFVDLWVFNTGTGAQIESVPFGIGPFTYLWSTGETTPVIDAIDGGTYCVSVTDATGCVAAGCATVDVIDSCFVWLGCDPPGTMTAFGFGVEPYTYEWSTGDTTMMITTDPGETYCVTVTDATGCAADACMTVDTFNFPDSICDVAITAQIFPDYAVLTATSFGLPPMMTEYQWSTGDIGPFLTVDQSGTYCVTAISTLTGCVATSCIDVVLDPIDSTCLVAIAAVLFPDSGYAELTATSLGFSGNGNFFWNTGDTGAVITVYQSGYYCVEAFSDSLNCIATSCIEVILDPQPSSYNIEGLVLQVPDLEIDGTTYLLKETLNGVDVIDSLPMAWNPMDTIQAIFFEFLDLEDGTYYLKFTSNDDDYVPTYHFSSIAWDNADPITVPHPEGDFYPIFVFPVSPLNGPGFIGGMITNGTNFNMDPSRNSDPVPGVSIILSDVNNNPLDHYYSDGSGEFQFGSLPWGIYRLTIDHLNIPSKTIEIEITPQNPVIPSVLIEFDGDEFTTAIANIADYESVSIYPNPTTDYIMLEFPALERELNVTMIGATGRQVLKTQIEKGETHERISTGELAPGVYLLYFDDGETRYYERVMKVD